MSAPLIPPEKKSLFGQSWRRWSAPLGGGLQTLGLALMVGGMLALGAFTAPAVFGGVPRDLAAPVMALIFRRYDGMLMAGVGLLWFGEALKRLGGGVVPSGPNRFRMMLMILLSVALVYSTQFLSPEIARLNRSGVHRQAVTQAGKAFDDLHRRTERLYRAEWLMAVLLILITPFTLASAIVRPDKKQNTAAEFRS